MDSLMMMGSSAVSPWALISIAAFSSISVLLSTPVLEVLVFSSKLVSAVSSPVAPGGGALSSFDVATGGAE